MNKIFGMTSAKGNICGISCSDDPKEVAFWIKLDKKTYKKMSDFLRKNDVMGNSITAYISWEKDLNDKNG